ncbi:hypothetical protein P0W64_01915 [Tsukamurella sp. 8F]|uniref:hypothetical protein n=1 Tax=unclassified Tsukamurella TaxID=2633480 RepID=UPI0023B90674|nr:MULTISPECIES: hypothetical protein [unclassified Tsukamurella]MDF0528567.1 hypothetical protein [Tsukamurella sp. 8J]MDF0585529.1 hypothetical protein [Tsukamurella sp. 8F]
MSDEATSAAEQAAPAAPAGVVKIVKAFASRHGGANAVLQDMGEQGVRITLVGEDGILGDQVVADRPTAEAVAAEAGIETSEWVRDLVSKVTPEEPKHFRLMAGYRARSL